MAPQSAARRLYRRDPDVGHTFLPNVRARVPHEAGGFLVATNSLGFRDDKEPAAAPAPGRKRIFVFGDSFTAGDGVSNGHRYSDVLQTLLADVDVFNFGLSGSGTDQQFLAYRKFAAQSPCDLLIVAVLVENIRRVTSQFRPIETESGELALAAKPYFELRGEELVRFHDPVPLEPIREADVEDGRVYRSGRFPGLRKLVATLGLKEAAQRLTHYQPVPDYDDRDSASWRLMRAILLAWRRLHAGPTLLMPLPLYQHVEETASAANYQRRFAELAAEGGFALHDPLPDLLRYPLAERRAFRFKTDVHPTRALHRAIACSAAPAVARAIDGDDRPPGCAP
jgi:hypothetical protein